MSTPKLVEDFYQRIWNDGNLDAAADLLTPEFSFRGSLGRETPGREALADYRCEILSCVAEGDQAFVKMRFSGRQIARFRGYEPTGKIVHWLGAALFRFENSVIVELWVLGDLAGLDALLQAQATDRGERQ